MALCSFTRVEINKIIVCVCVRARAAWYHQTMEMRNYCPLNLTRCNCFLYQHFTPNDLVQTTWRAISPSGHHHVQVARQGTMSGPNHRHGHVRTYRRSNNLHCEWDCRACARFPSPHQHKLNSTKRGHDASDPKTWRWAVNMTVTKSPTKWVSF
jgi:hypothetical protein